MGVPARGQDATTVRADAIVVAAGRSTRMEGIDKLTADLCGRPLLAWSLDALAATPEVARIVVVTAPERLDEVRRQPWISERVVDVVAGGSRRQESVFAGFAALEQGHFDAPAPEVVLVHDGARPLIARELVSRVAAAAAVHGAAIPLVPVAETLKRIDGDAVAGTVDRADLGVAQTPQGVRRDILRDVYRRAPANGQATWTDEAAMLESAGYAVHVVPGDPANLKVTLPGDLGRAAAWLTGAFETRTGIGHDSHGFGGGRPLVLGGVEIPSVPRLHGHSDGDVVLHAIADALLGAAAMGDLGRLFPADSRTPEGVASTSLVASVVERVEAAGWRAASLDVTVIAARPRLAPHLEPMGSAIAALFGLDVDHVNVKASTGNLQGDDGAGRSVSAMAIVTIERRR
jgi:2-C-methyl-D-erythritol 4-phosphate cytidylyltransferase / 2-C-methyl-D-erythritol 2,4-cyclodiphosphate synthase